MGLTWGPLGGCGDALRPLWGFWWHLWSPCSTSVLSWGVPSRSFGALGFFLGALGGPREQILYSNPYLGSSLDPSGCPGSAGGPESRFSIKVYMGSSPEPPGWPGSEGRPQRVDPLLKFMPGELSGASQIEKAILARASLKPARNTFFTKGVPQTS